MKTKDRILKMKCVDAIDDERSLEHCIFVYYKPGWKSSTDPMVPMHMDCTDTWTEALEHAKSALPCSCNDCKEGFSWNLPTNAPTVKPV